MTVKHSTTLGSSTDDGSSPVSKNAWIADHTGTNDHDHSATGSGGVLPVVPGQLIGYNVDHGGIYTTTSASLVDVDATHDAVTFDAPPSGNVLVRLTGNAAAAATVSSLHSWGLRAASSNIAGVAGNSVAVRSESTATIQYVNASMTFVITGLTPSSSYTYKWAFASSSGTATLGGGTGSDLTMEVIALP